MRPIESALLNAPGMMKLKSNIHQVNSILVRHNACTNWKSCGLNTENRSVAFIVNAKWVPRLCITSPEIKRQIQKPRSGSLAGHTIVNRPSAAGSALGSW